VERLAPEHRVPRRRFREFTRLRVPSRGANLGRVVRTRRLADDRSAHPTPGTSSRREPTRHFEQTPPFGRFAVHPGQPLEFNVRASDPDDGDAVRLSVSGLPPGAVFPVPSAANPLMSTFTWIPPPEIRFGTQTVKLMAIDGRGLTAMGAIEIMVVVPSAVDLRRFVVAPGIQELDMSTGASAPIYNVRFIVVTDPAAVALRRIRVVGEVGEVPDIGFDPPATPFETNIHFVRDPIQRSDSGDFVVTVESRSMDPVPRRNRGSLRPLSAL
jgi:hypothetical protein